MGGEWWADIFGGMGDCGGGWVLLLLMSLDASCEISKAEFTTRMEPVFLCRLSGRRI